MVVYVTGVPGVGKSTLCRRLCDLRPNRYVHVSFGALILAAIGESGLTEKNLRESAASLVTSRVLRLATEKLIAEVDQSPAGILLLIDSHAVSQDRFGYVVTPDGPDYFGRLRYQAIIQLFASPTTVLAMSLPAASGRQARTARDIDVHFALQSAVSVNYAAANGCPLLLVDAGPPADVLAATVNRLLGLRLEQH